MSLNVELKEKFEEIFKPLGIVAYSCCCSLGCTFSYESCSDFHPRSRGICFIKLYLDGMNYDENPTCCYAEYSDLDYITEHWDEEYQLLVKWTSVLGLEPNQFTITMPPNEDISIKIQFHQPLALEIDNYCSSDEFNDENDPLDINVCDSQDFI